MQYYDSRNKLFFILPVLAAFCCMVYLLVLPGCSSNGTLAPVKEGWEQVITTQKYHTVAPEDTLYSIAWRYGLDFRNLAELNQLESPYHLKVGQKLRLDAGVPVAIKPVKAIAPVKITPVPTEPEIVPISKPSIVQPVEQAAASPVGNALPAPIDNSITTEQWAWPAQGRVINGFSTSMGVNRGVDITGQAGDPIYAAASGKIVYCGTGLRGYGALLIIKHNDEFLSAYAHNRKLLVKDGQWVKSGQMIAEMGDTEAQRVLLHFEIRQAGKPVDPLKFLPPRS